MAARVVVTGLGALSPLEAGVQKSWTSLLAGKSGITPISQLPDAASYTAHCPATCGVGKVSNFSPEEYGGLFSTQDLRRMSLFTQYATVAAREALEDAGLLHDRYYDKEKFGCVIGSGIASISDTFDTVGGFIQGKKVSPLFVPKILNNMAAGNLSIKFGLQGVTHCVSTACATGNNSIGDAYNFIRLGYSDSCLAGASEASVHPLALAGFLRAKSITTAGISRPFDSLRDGFVLAEGAGILVLENLEYAQRRGARIYAEIVGYGVTSDAYHITSPLEGGDGARRAMQMALGDHDPRSVGYVNAHATSTILGDRAEARAIRDVFNARNNRESDICVSSNKGAIGHLLGAAGAMEAIFTIKSLYHDTIPHTLNLNTVGGAKGDDETDFQGLNFVRDKPIARKMEYALNNSFGFGGVNSAILFKKWDEVEQVTK
ncbi:LAMI_0G12002g1_1 [Lachancea mirantina]|uniref:3-oxoacyl-[acyl-carrier-protein] synthase n=1 Tax=Lachancea mirantina TaxID=1230905 RepID=A0A1G4KBG0_9SACH|nr:LAMI_0G12002g1_1 [Lachancea mirantina]